MVASSIHPCAGAATWADALRLRFRSLRGRPPVLVYSMGKTGSSAVLAALRQTGLPNPVYHVHLLSQAWIGDFTRFYQGLQPPVWPEHMRTGAVLRRELDWGPVGRWKVITLVREPIRVRISAFFENVGQFNPELIDSAGGLCADEALRFLRTTLAGFASSPDLIDRYFRCWFESEFRQALGVDVFAQPFDHARGYTVLRGSFADVLILRYEDLGRCFSEAARAFLGLSTPLELPRVNVGAEKALGEAYRQSLEHVGLTVETCQQIYALPCVRHFYTPEMLARFTQEWTERR